MSKEIERGEWSDFLKDLGEANSGRLITLKVSGAKEDGGDGSATIHTEAKNVSLSGLDLETRGESSPAVQIMLVERDSPKNNLTHTVSRVVALRHKSERSGTEETLEITTEDGEKAVLLFEFEPVRQNRPGIF